MKQKLNNIIRYILAAKIELITLCVVVFVDVLTKTLIENAIPLYESKTLIPDLLYFYYTRNTGAAFSFSFGLDQILSAEGVAAVFVMIAFVCTIAFFVLMVYFKNRMLIVRLSLALIIAGAIGNNLIDRPMLGYVRDFIQIVYLGFDLPFLGTSFAIFNVADIALTTGVALFFVYFIFYYDSDTSRLKQLADSNKADAIAKGESADIIQNQSTGVDRETASETDG